MSFIAVSLKIIPLVFTALFPVVNPIGTAFVLLGMTSGMGTCEYRALVRKISILSFLLLTAFFLMGRYLLELFGISVPVVQVSGGTVLAAMGWNLLNRADSTVAATATATESRDSRPAHNAFYPFTFPVTIGPGCIAVALTLSAHIEHGNWETMSLQGFSALVGIALICVLTYLCFAHVVDITRCLSVETMQALSKLLYFLVICIGVEIASHGLKSMHF